MNRFLKGLDLYFHDLLTLLPFDFGDKAYERFVIIGRSRVGSNMLRSILNKHPAIISYGELFRKAGEVGWGIPYYWHNRISLFNEDVYLMENPIGFLENRIYKKYNKRMRAVGFKLFYYHARSNGWEKVWEYIRNNKFKIIHLKRKDLLRVHVSRQLAEMTGEWKNKKYGKSIVIDPLQCKKDFQLTEKWWKETDDFFKDNPVLELWYGDLVADQSLWVKRILDFLEIQESNFNLEPSTKKQSGKTTSALIDNYDELDEFFSGTKWEYLFRS